MTGKKGNSNMLIPTLVLGVLAVVFLYLGYRGGEGQHIAGLKNSVRMIVEIVPLLLCAFIVASMAQILIPQELLSKWIGGESGMRGIFIGTVAGGVAPGGPFVSLPVAAGLFRAGAGVGTMVAFLTGWSLWAVARIPMEIGVLGWKLTAIRLVCTFFFPPIAGLIAQALFGGVKTL
jgi:uncharacterized membrane protein YraQ (UPF0718 family)